jgi:large subunit ribosomal protein L24e
MVEKRDCSFCGSPIEPGTGLLYVKRDGTRYQFCSSKCRRNLLDLGRVPRTVKWTKHYIKGLGKGASMQARGKKAAPEPKAPKKEVAAAATTGGGAASAAPEAPAAPKAAKAEGGPKAKGEAKAKKE